MSDLENDLKRVLRQRADGDHVTGPEAMLGRVEKGAARLHRRRVAAVALSTLAIVTAGATVALSAGNLTNTNPQVVGPTTSPTPGTSQSTTVPTLRPPQTVSPPIGGIPSNTASTGPTTLPSSPTTQPTATRTVVPGVVVTDFQVSDVAAYGANTIRVLGTAQCDGLQCYPVLVSTDGGKTFQYDGTVPGQVYSFGFDGINRWAQGPGKTVWQSWDAGKTWEKHIAPGAVQDAFGRGTPVLRIGGKLYQGGGLPYFYPIEERFERVDDYSVWGRAVVSGDDNGTIGVTVSNSDHVPRPTGCKTTSTLTEVSAGPGDVIWLMCPTADGPVLRLSTDAGRTWRVVPAKVPRLGSVTQIAAVSATSALFYTGPTSKATLVSAGGATREVVITGLAQVDELFFQTSQIGYAAGLSQLHRTTDGGKTWQRIRFDGFE
jgi:hypothetical protein